METEVGGVPTHWAPGPPPFTGCLMFRVGRAHETFSTSGITHLVEHLALYKLGRQAFEFNGSVSETTTRFFATGDPEEVAGFLAGVTRSLSDLDADRLATEKRILATEAAAAGGAGVDARLLNMRFGSRGFGLSAVYEWGLDRVEADEVLAWASRHFTAGNARLWLTGPPPDGLVLDLPPGNLSAPPSLTEVSDLQLPAYVKEGTGGVAFGSIVPRGWAISLASAIARTRAHEKLRLQEGQSYAVENLYHPLDADTSHAGLVADCQDQSAAKVRDLLLGVIDDLAANGASDEEREWHLDQRRRGDDDPRNIVPFLDLTAENSLVGAPSHGVEEAAAHAAEVGSDDVASAIAEAAEGMIMCVPSATVEERPSRFRSLPEVPKRSLGGTPYRPTGIWRQWGERSEVHVSAEGLTISIEDSGPHAISFDECVGVITGLGGTLQLVDGEGNSLTMQPGKYEDGHSITKSVRAGVAEQVWIPLDERQRQLLPVVELELGQALVDLLPREVDSLPAVLADDEMTEHLAKANKGNRTGLLVVTRRRVLFLFRGREDEFWESERANLSSVATKGLVNKRLRIAVKDETVEFTDIAPEGRLGEIAATLDA